MGCRRKVPTTFLDEQFVDFASMMDSRRDGTTINLFRLDYWLLQSKIIDNRKVTLVDTGISFKKYLPKPPPPVDKKKKKNSKKKEEETEIIRLDEIKYPDFLKFLRNLCRRKKIDLEQSKERLRQCGLPGHIAPPIRPYYYYIPRNKWPEEKEFYVPEPEKSIHSSSEEESEESET